VFKIVWTNEAVEALDLIVTYIEQFDPDAAARLAQKIIAVADSHRNFLTVDVHRRAIRGKLRRFRLM
jgi:plasmid stabilization system protein ParE